MLTYGINPPISLYLLRPHMLFEMGALVVGAGGEQTGFTVIGNSNFELSDEATTKTALGHYTTYFKPIIHTPKNVMVCPDAVFQGYYGGGNTNLISYEEYLSSNFYSIAKDSGDRQDLVVMLTRPEDSMDGVVPVCGTFSRIQGSLKSLAYLASSELKTML